LSRCGAGTRRWSELSVKGGGGAGGGGGTMQTFSFADSKLGYLTAARGALVVRVKSCATAPPPRVTSSRRAAAAAAADGGGGDNDVMMERCSHLADETGNFTLAPRRSVSAR